MEDGFLFVGHGFESLLRECVRKVEIDRWWGLVCFEGLVVVVGEMFELGTDRWN